MRPAPASLTPSAPNGRVGIALSGSCAAKLIASVEVDDSLLEALEDYVKRQRERLEKKDEAAN